jgi:hypothetical protein
MDSAAYWQHGVNVPADVVQPRVERAFARHLQGEPAITLVLGRARPALFAYRIRTLLAALARDTHYCAQMDKRKSTTEERYAISSSSPSQISLSPPLCHAQASSFMRDIDKLSTAEGLCRQLAQYTFETAADELVEDTPLAAPSHISRKSGRQASVKELPYGGKAQAPILGGAWDEVAAVDAPKIIHVSSSPKVHKKVYVDFSLRPTIDFFTTPSPLPFSYKCCNTHLLRTERKRSAPSRKAQKTRTAGIVQTAIESGRVAQGTAREAPSPTSTARVRVSLSTTRFLERRRIAIFP